MCYGMKYINRYTIVPEDVIGRDPNAYGGGVVPIISLL